MIKTQHISVTINVRVLILIFFPYVRGIFSKNINSVSLLGLEFYGLQVMGKNGGFLSPQ